jgi:predicted CoA-substrate-specific enzyme activase
VAQHFLGIDLGSSYTKFTAVDNAGMVAHIGVIPTLSRRREEFEKTMEQIATRYNVVRTCATGYGRSSIETDDRKTELVCAAAGVSFLHPTHKCILDIGGEDIKIIEADSSGRVVSFFMNDKCSAGTGTFITEIAERAELDTAEMNELARNSNANQIMNSFCTVFAKSEILSWKCNGTPIEDIARGIYLSVVDRVCKLPIKTDLPVFFCGGVVAYHPYLCELLDNELHTDITVVADPQYSISLGAAVLARNAWSRAHSDERKNLLDD